MRIFHNLYTPNPWPLDISNRERGRYYFDGHSWPFRLEKDWEIVDNIDDADIVPMLFETQLGEELFDGLKPHQTVLFLSIFHIDDHYHRDFYIDTLNDYKKFFSNLLLVHKNKNIVDGDGLIYYDSMFNRHKLFCTEYDKVQQWKNEIDPTHFDFVWTVGTTRDTYALPDLDKDITNLKVFLHTGLVYELLYKGNYVPRMLTRITLKDYLKKMYSDKGYISDSDNFFLPNNPGSYILHHYGNGGKSGGIWYPVGDEYYRKSLVNIYVETLTTGKFGARCVTEKTFDPLIKGNFILPYGYPGLVEDVKKYGFQFPDIIDTSYDSKVDNNERFVGYIDAVNKVCTSKDIVSDYQRNKHILQHNRSVFYDTPYYPLHDKVKEQIRT